MVAVKPAGLLEVMLTPTLFVKSWLIVPFAQVFGRVMATVRTSLTLTLKIVLSLQVVILFDTLQSAKASSVATEGINTMANKKAAAMTLATLAASVFFLTISSL